ncbi:hypothetical protein ACHHYP_10436 [Achlya hypogyna]|uniref:BZIP domain-containing protein n=1 Tax=Achlya hypogyna TaxID=1202772 RepID=A0A1V9YLF3_ACHHY|nr:hypothetical protein ACHHYP_10436 [Achlya hypogyna]
MELDTKRQYNRRKQREYRERLEGRLRDLRLLVTHLQRELDRRDPSKALLLPWADVAKGLQAAAAKSQRTNAALKHHVRQLRALYRALLSWVYLPLVIHPACFALQSRPFALARIGLAADPKLRRTSCDWLLTRLYHHVDALLAEHDLPIGPTPLTDLFVAPMDAGVFEYVTRRRIVVAAPLERVAAAYALLGHHDCGHLAIAGRADLDPELARVGIVYSQATYERDGSPWRDNRLWRVHSLPGRVVVVSQNVHDDPLHPPTLLQRHRYSIIDATALPDGTTCCRELKVCSHAFDGRVFVPLALEAALLGCDLQAHATAAAKRRTFVAFVTRTIAASQAHWAGAFARALALT